MPAQHHEPPTRQQQMTTTPATSAARYAVGPSKGRSNGEASAPGVAEALGHQGVPDQETPADTAEQPLPRAADEAALHRVARRRKREAVQRTKRVDVRYSYDEHTKVLAEARALNIAGAHFVGAVVMAYVDGELTLPGQRSPIDDYIDELNALRSQVATIGRNVNQIAKRLNSGGHPHPGDTTLLAQTDRTLDAVGATVKDIAEAANRAVSSKAA
jgi:hypothetical protein